MGRIANCIFILVPLLFVTSPAFAQNWCPVVNLGMPPNSSFNENFPTFTPDGLALYFQSNRPGGVGGTDLWVSRRANHYAPWGTPMNLGAPINYPGQDSGAIFTSDGLTMYYASDRPGGEGLLDIWVSTRTDPNDDFGWSAPENVGDVINTEHNDAPNAFEFNEAGQVLRMWFARDNGLDPTGIENFDIWTTKAHTKQGYWGQPKEMTNFNSIYRDGSLAIRPDSLEIAFTTNRPGGVGMTDIWFSTRATTEDEWGPPFNGPAALNTTVRDVSSTYYPTDPATLILYSTRPGGFGLLDIYFSTRTCP
jgi:hypothetical protein